MTQDIREQTRLYYDAEASAYDSNRYVGSAGRRVAVFHQRILGSALIAHLATDARVIDVGCGTGRLLEHLAPHGYRLHGIDMSRGMLAVAERRLLASGSPVVLRECDAATIPFDTGSFDAAYSILAINLMPDYHRVLREVARLLKPGGAFVFNVPNLASIYVVGGLYVNARGRANGTNSAGHRYSHWFRPAEWELALADAGFTIEVVWGQPPHVRLVDNAEPLNAKGLGLLLSKSVYIYARRRRE